MPKQREIEQELTFNNHGTFQSLYAAHRWLKDNGYSYGSTCKDRKTGANCPVAIMYGSYQLPEKWINFDKESKSLINGIITSNDWREGEVKVIIYT